MPNYIVLPFLALSLLVNSVLSRSTNADLNFLDTNAQEETSPTTANAATGPGTTGVATTSTVGSTTDAISASAPHAAARDPTAANDPSAVVELVLSDAQRNRATFPHLVDIRSDSRLTDVLLDVAKLAFSPTYYPNNNNPQHRAARAAVVQKALVALNKLKKEYPSPAREFEIHIPGQAEVFRVQDETEELDLSARIFPLLTTPAAGVVRSGKITPQGTSAGAPQGDVLGDLFFAAPPHETTPFTFTLRLTPNTVMRRDVLYTAVVNHLKTKSNQLAVQGQSSRAVCNGYLLWDKTQPDAKAKESEWWSANTLGTAPKITLFFSESIDWKNTPVTSFAILSVLLLIGKALRILIKPLRDLYLPSSVVGGMFGYFIVLLLQNVGQEGCVADDTSNLYPPNGKGYWGCKPGTTKPYSYVSTYYLAGWDKLPEVLIGVIFAAVFIGVEVPPCKAIWEGSGPQIMYGQVVTHGLWFFGLAFGWLCGLLFLTKQETEQAAWVDQNKQAVAQEFPGTTLTTDNMDQFVGKSGTTPLSGAESGTFWTGNQPYHYPADTVQWDVQNDHADWLPKCYGMAMYLGFEGGHGTVAGLKNDFPDMMGWRDGFDVGIGMATTGLLGATIWGVLLINIATRRGWLAKTKKGAGSAGAGGEQAEEGGGELVDPTTDQPQEDPMLLVGVYSPGPTRPVMGYETTVSDSIDTLSVHAALVGLACLTGYGIQKTIIVLEGLAMPKDPEKPNSPSLGENFPLFPLCMVGGIIVDKLLRCINMSILIDHNCMQRVSGIALDYLITAVLCTMNLQAATGWGFATVAFIVLNVVGFAWHFLCILVFAPKMLPDCWFERAIFEVGHSMGTTANGLILLKMVDPHSETAAPSAVAFKLFIHEPMMGLWVAFISWTFKTADKKDGRQVLGWAGASLGMLVLWVALYLCYFRNKYKRDMMKNREEFVQEMLDSSHGEVDSSREQLVLRTSTAAERASESFMKDVSDCERGERGEGIPRPRVSRADSSHSYPDSDASRTTDLGHLMALSSRLLRREGGAHGHGGSRDVLPTKRHSSSGEPGRGAGVTSAGAPAHHTWHGRKGGEQSSSEGNKVRDLEGLFGDYFKKDEGGAAASGGSGAAAGPPADGLSVIQEETRRKSKESGSP